MIQTLGNCHSTGLRADCALSYAIARVARSANRARKTIRSTRMVSLRDCQGSVPGSREAKRADNGFERLNGPSKSCSTLLNVEGLLAR